MVMGAKFSVPAVSEGEMLTCHAGCTITPVQDEWLRRTAKRGHITVSDILRLCIQFAMDME